MIKEKQKLIILRKEIDLFFSYNKIDIAVPDLHTKIWGKISGMLSNNLRYEAEAFSDYFNNKARLISSGKEITAIILKLTMKELPND